MGSITFLQVVDDLLEGGCTQSNKLPGSKVLLQVGFRQTKIFKVEVGAAVFAFTDRVGFGNQVPLFTVSQYQAVNTKFTRQLRRIGKGSLSVAIALQGCCPGRFDAVG